ncbi:acetyl-CoA C-acyltransferase [bacterium]|nr:acetyl-CoA C-acyltransferase [bacterium]
MNKKIAIIGGIRTPFVRAGAEFRNLTLKDLGAAVVKGTIERLNLDPAKIDELIMGTVLLDPRIPNWSREILFAAGLPKTVYAYAVSNNCISGLVAIAAGFDRLGSGRANLILAGGTESMSNPAVLFSPQASSIFLNLARTKTLGQKLSQVLKLRPKHFAPHPPGITEPSTGLTMGQHMELTAQKLAIARQIQDEIALRSHQNAARAWAEGIHQHLTMTVQGVTSDTIVRKDTSLEKLAKLQPVFDRKGSGTLTAGNSSALTDGASCVALASAEAASKLNQDVLAWISDYEFSAIDASDGLLMAPAVAVPRLLSRHNLKLEDFDLIEIHEAFGAQVAANVWAWENGWKEPACGKIDWQKVNTLGGSIALGHPFAATGGRIAVALAHELKRKNLKRGLISICAAGAMAGAMILER